MKTEQARFTAEEALKALIDQAVPLPLARLGYEGLLWCSYDEVSSAERVLRTRAEFDWANIARRLKREMRQLDIKYVIELPASSLIWAATGKRWKP